MAAVYGAAYDPRAVVCIDQSLRFGDFARVVQARAEQLQGPETMQAVVSIEHALGLEPYSGVEDLERRVLGFPREVVLGVWHALLSIPPDQLTATAEALLPRISAPLLSLHGSPPPPDYEPWLTRLVPQARVEAWNGTGHMLHLVDPGRFISRVRHCSRAATWIGTASRTSGGFTIVAPVAQMHELEREECLKLLERGGFGRLAVNAGGGAPAIRPVNYVFDHSSQSVVFRTAPGSKLHGLLRSGRAAFEIDGTDPVDRTGWSVVVVGAAEEVTGASELRRLEQSGLEPWGPGEKPHWMRIRATTISGRKITRD